MDVKTIIAALEAAAAVAEVAQKLVAEVSGVLSSHDQSEVHVALNKLIAKNDVLSASVRTALAQAAKE